MTKLDTERAMFYMHCSDDTLELCMGGKELNIDEVTDVLNEVWKFGYMELYNDIIRQNIKVINEEAEYYENMPDPWFWKYIEEKTKKKVYDGLQIYMKTSGGK